MLCSSVPISAIASDSRGRPVVIAIHSAKCQSTVVTGRLCVGNVNLTDSIGLSDSRGSMQQNDLPLAFVLNKVGSPCLMHVVLAIRQGFDDLDFALWKNGLLQLLSYPLAETIHLENAYT